MDAEVPVELVRAQERFDRQQARIVKQQGEGGHVGALAVTQRFIPQLADAFREATKTITSSRYRELIPTLRELDPELLGLCCFQTLFHCIAHGKTLRSLCFTIGGAVSCEMWAAGLSHDNPRLAKRIEKAVRRKHGSVKYRKQAARKAAEHAGYDYKGKLWGVEEKVRCGEFCLNVVLETLPNIFQRTTVPFDGSHILVMTDEALRIGDEAIAQAVMSNPVWLPDTQPPRPWSDMDLGGTNSRILQPSLALVRTKHKETRAAIRNAIHDGRMQPLLDKVNALQSVAWTINKRMLGLMRECVRRGIKIKGIRTGIPEEWSSWDAEQRRKWRALPRPDMPENFDELDEKQKRAWRIRAGQIALADLQFKNDIALQTEDLKTAEVLAEHERFYTAMNMDWRGRVYAVPSFNFQRDDRVRALFLFADGEPIGEEGLRWLKVHVANCGDFDKISKQTFEERIKWVDAHLDQIEELSWTPLSPTSVSWWTAADKPFLFLAACLELVSAMTTGPTYVSRLPISFDGSCSGLQHLCAMSRATEGSLVNLTPSEKPKDVYQVVADQVVACVEAQAAATASETDAPETELANTCLAFGITRKLLKRNVMTYSYSSKKFGMSQQHLEDTMRPLKTAVLLGEIDEHPFGADEGRAAAKYLAGHTYDAIEQIMVPPARAMTFLQQIAKVLAHEGKPVTWTTPVGLPWINRYHEPTVKKFQLYLHDRGVRVPLQISIANGSEKAINKDKSANAIAPNIVHALDASHLLLVVGACVREGISQLATVHDSFGCLASRAQRFRQIILQQFVELYEQHDPLAEVLAQAKLDLTPDSHSKLPTLPPKGSLNIKEVLNAQFAFA